MKSIAFSSLLLNEFIIKKWTQQCHSWWKIIPSRPLRHIRPTTREGNPYHHSCYARNVPYNPAWPLDHPGLKSHTIPGSTKFFTKKKILGWFFLKIDYHHYTVLGLTKSSPMSISSHFFEESNFHPCCSNSKPLGNGKFKFVKNFWCDFFLSSSHSITLCSTLHSEYGKSHLFIVFEEILLICIIYKVSQSIPISLRQAVMRKL